MAPTAYRGADAFLFSNFSRGTGRDWKKEIAIRGSRHKSERAGTRTIRRPNFPTRAEWENKLSIQSKSFNLWCR